MMTLKLSGTALLSLLQWCDTLFPSGAFSHSFGLESATQSGKVKNGKDLSHWIRSKLKHQVFSCDLLLVALSHRASCSSDFIKIQQLDGLSFALRLPREIREGGQMIAFRLIKTASELYPASLAKYAEKLCSSGKLKGDPAVAFGLVAVAANIPVEAALFGYIYMFISGQVSAALRLISIGQQQGQEIIHHCLEWAEDSGKISESLDRPEKEISSFMPALEIGAMQHEAMRVRLFQS